MPVFKNEDNGTWYVMARYVNWKGGTQEKMQAWLSTKREAQEWKKNVQIAETSFRPDMSFEAFTELFISRCEEPFEGKQSWLTKEHIIRTKILPYLKTENQRDFPKGDYYLVK